MTPTTVPFVTWPGLRAGLLLALALALPGAASAQPPPINVVHPLPPAPPWLDGFQVRWPVRVAGNLAKQTTAKTVLVALPTGGWLKPDATDLAAQAPDGTLLPLAVLSHDPAGSTIVQFKRAGDAPWYWIYGVSPAGKSGPRADRATDATFKEGVTAEVRAWTGTDLSSWAKVRDVLQKNDRVIANGIVGEVLQSGNPARPDVTKQFAVSYRGAFHVQKPGVHRFLVNADAAVFLFVDGFKVFERPGANNLTLGAVKVKALDKLAGNVNLAAGVHTFEVHHVNGADPRTQGRCVLLWSTPDSPKFKLLPPSVMAQPLYARAAALERRDPLPSPFFCHGLDDTIDSGGLKLFLVRFEAQGPLPADTKLTWDFGDGSTGTGTSPVHIYFKEGDYTVSLKADGSPLPPYRTVVHVWPEPGENSPFSLSLAVKLLGESNWKTYETARLREVFAFLRTSNQPEAWPLLSQLTEHLLAQKGLDLETQAQLVVTRIEALTHTGRAADALKLATQARPRFAKTPALDVRVRMGEAAVYQYHYRDAAAASKIYKSILDDHGRTEHASLRLAGIRWGDLFAETGDLARAAETYRTAATLGGERFVGGVTDPAKRGALLRIAEQKLRAGEVRQVRRLLDRLELEYPGRRLDGLYCFLRAESSRHAGRYEDALRHYEMIFKLPQWAGYRGRALLGLANAYLHMGDLERALKSMKELKESHAKFYKDQKADELHKILVGRQARVKEAAAKGDPSAAFFRGYTTGLEPDEAVWFGNLTDGAIVRAPGISGPHVGLLDAFPEPIRAIEYYQPLTDLTPGTSYVIEVWYRDIYRPAPPAGLAAQPQHVTAYLIGTAAPQPATSTQVAIYRGTHHQWHKLTFLLKAPPAQDCTLKLHFLNVTGVQVFDRVSIRPVSDRRLDALTTFLEGAKTP